MAVTCGVKVKFLSKKRGEQCEWEVAEVQRFDYTFGHKMDG